MDSTPAWVRIALAALLLVIALLEGLRLVAAVGVVGGAYAVVTHAALMTLAALAGAGLWRRAPWAAGAIVGLGIVFATTRIVDALVLGIRPWLFALLAAIAALAAAFVLAAWARAGARRRLTS
jgi:hypothetical protein